MLPSTQLMALTANFANESTWMITSTNFADM